MASLPIQPPIGARVDRDGHLTAADAPLLALQREAGAALGQALAVPQLAAVARLAARLGVSITRPVLAASDDEDIDLLVRADPDPDGVSLTVERWTPRIPARPRWSGAASGHGESEERAAAEDVRTDAALRILSIGPGLARRLEIDPADFTGQPLMRLLRPVEDDEGNLPLVEAFSERGAFKRLPASHRGGEQRLLLDGQPRFEDERFLGYSISVAAEGGGAALTPLPPLDDLLREPLSSIIGQAQAIADRSQGPLRTDYAGYGADIASAASHLLELLTALGRQAGAEGGAAPAGEKVDLAELVLDAASLVQAQASTRGVILDVGGVGHLPAIGQPRAITQILVNLIGNAARYSPEGGTVVITLADDRDASVTVSDSGPGVAPADRVRIFERFEQAEPANGGAGLGLAISRRLARDMGGEVELLDVAAGASFRLTLPRA